MEFFGCRLWVQDRGQRSAAFIVCCGARFLLIFVLLLLLLAGAGWELCRHGKILGNSPVVIAWLNYMGRLCAALCSGDFKSNMAPNSGHRILLVVVPAPVLRLRACVSSCEFRAWCGVSKRAQT